MARPEHSDYETTGQWMVACVIADQIADYDLPLPIPTAQEISDAIDGCYSGTSLGEYIGAAWEAAGEVVYNMFPEFRDPDAEE